MVLKPSELAPLSAIIIAELIDEAGFPKGVFNLVNGDGAITGDALTSHPDVNMISFTGSTRAGALISQNAAKDFKRISLELGGKGANIVFKTAPGAYFNYNKYKEVVDLIQGWDKRADTTSIGAAQWAIYYNYFLGLGGKQLSPEERMDRALKATDKHLMKYFRRYDIQLGDYQIHHRGNPVEPEWRTSLDSPRDAPGVRRQRRRRRLLHGAPVGVLGPTSANVKRVARVSNQGEG